MATVAPSLFVRFNLTPEEYKAGAVFSLAQKQHIQNEICAAAEEKVRLKYDPANPLAFAQAEAEIQGKIFALTYLLEESDRIQTKDLQQRISDGE